MVITTLSIGDLVIYEPVTAITDYIITIIALLFYIRIKPANETVKNWRLFFLLLGISTLFGGTSHAFFPVHDGWQYKSFWLPMQLINGFAIYFAQQATLLSVLQNSGNSKTWKYIYIIQLITYIVVLMIVQKYIVTIIENALGLIPIMILHLRAGTGKESYKLIGYGIAVSFITAIVHGLKFSLHDYFNYNDIAHIFIMISLYIMYKGVRQQES